MLKTGHEGLIEGELLGLNGDVEVLGDGEEPGDHKVLLLQGGQLRPHAGQEGQMLHKLLYGLGLVV